MNIHVDNRRTLVGFGEGYIWKSCKIIHVHTSIPIGEHFHKIKTEGFYLIEGWGTITIDKKSYEFSQKDFFIVKPGQVHTLVLTPKSILLGLATEIYDPKDEYKP